MDDVEELVDLALINFLLLPIEGGCLFKAGFVVLRTLFVDLIISNETISKSLLQLLSTSLLEEQFLADSTSKRVSVL